MSLLFVTVRTGVAAAAGYALVWGFSPADPEAARFAGQHQFRLPEISIPKLGVADAARTLLSGEARVGAASASEIEPEIVRIAPPFSGLQLPASAFELARAGEPLRLEAAPAPDGGWIIGYGRRTDQRPPEPITEAQAEAMLREDLRRAEAQVRDAVEASLSEEEYAALVEFARSIGAAQFERTLVVILLNQGNREMAADAFMVWTNEEVGGVLVQNPDLVEQRERTRELFLSASARS